MSVARGVVATDWMGRERPSGPTRNMGVRTLGCEGKITGGCPPDGPPPKRRCLMNAGPTCPGGGPP